MATEKEIPQRAMSDPNVAAERLRGRVRAGVDAARTPPPSFRLRVAFALAAAAMVAVVVVASASDMVHGRVAGLEVTWGATVHLVAVLCLLVLLLASATYLSLTRGARGLGASGTVLAASMLLAVPAYAAAVLIFPVHAADPAALAEGLSPWGARCLVVATTVGMVVLGALAAALRHAVPVAKRRRGGAVGAVAGLWSGVAVFVFCPASDFNHLLIGHVVPVAAFVVLGLIVAPRFLRS